MAFLELPHTAGCLVCGRDNPHGLHLHFDVDPDSAKVETHFTPSPYHIGFEGIIHGGVLATVLDEAMVWAATWAGKRFCVAAEMTIRFRNAAAVGRPLRVIAEVESSRSRVIQTTGQILREDGEIIATATGKYMYMSPERHKLFLATLLDEPTTAPAAAILRNTGVSPVP